MGGPAHEAYPEAPAEDSVNGSDPVSKVERRDHAVRQKLVKLEMAKVRLPPSPHSWLAPHTPTRVRLTTEPISPHTAVAARAREAVLSQRGREPPAELPRGASRDPGSRRGFACALTPRPLHARINSTCKHTWRPPRTSASRR